MTINEFIPIALLIFLGTFSLYTLVDRVCNCIEHCSLMKNAGGYSKNCDDKTENFE